MNTIRETRERLGLAQYQLAVEMGKSTTWLWKVEVGVLHPKPEDRRRLAEFLSEPESVLFPETP